LILIGISYELLDTKMIGVNIAQSENEVPAKVVVICSLCISDHSLLWCAAYFHST